VKTVLLSYYCDVFPDTPRVNELVNEHCYTELFPAVLLLVASSIGGQFVGFATNSARKQLNLVS
jgi:hypothetical protein